MQLARSFAPDPLVQPIVVKSVVLRPVEKTIFTAGHRKAHVTVLIFPQCQLALVACGDHLAWGGPKRSYKLTDERWQDQFETRTENDHGPCQRCFKRLLTKPDEHRVKWLKDASVRYVTRNGQPPGWIAEELALIDGRRPLKVMLGNHPFWQAVKLWQKQLDGSRR